MNESDSRLHLYIGDGKGKTTAAAGLALRALGHGQSVLFAQFLKDGRSGELAALRVLPGARVEAGEPIRKFVFQMDDGERAAARERQTAHAGRLAALVAEEKPHLTVLDEMALAAALDLVAEDAARRLIEVALLSGEVVVTGRSAPEWLSARADYISDIASRRHPYDGGLAAREGVEW